jgi:hypothetical protein
MPKLPFSHVALNSSGCHEEQAFSNLLTAQLNDALAWPSFIGSANGMRQLKTVILSHRNGESVVRLTTNERVSIEQTGAEPLSDLIAKALANRFTPLDP